MKLVKYIEYDVINIFCILLFRYLATTGHRRYVNMEFIVYI